VRPGGGTGATFPDYPEALVWVRSIYARTRWTTSVCTGSLILRAAGLLKGLGAQLIGL